MNATARRRTETNRSWGGPTEAFGKLAGHWSLDRIVADRAALSGKAVFVETTEGHLAYHEHGRMTLFTGAEFDAERRYLFKQQPNGFAVHFVDRVGGLFHEIALTEFAGQLIGEAVHLCGEDRYCSRYAFGGDGNTFAISHRVIGPNKHYTLETTYRRSAEYEIHLEDSLSP